ncbi:MAG: phage holin family protein [Acidobacteria bacterium]|nr:phage holin family protein [Acidobacteriota bacterium]
MSGWIDLFRSLGESLLEVVRAELAALQEDFQRSGRHFGVALGLFGAAAVLLFWMVGLLLFAVVAILHIWLPLWGAALIVLALFVLATAILGVLGARQIRQVENPLETVRRRVDNHLDWWQHSFLSQPRTLDVEPAAAADPESLGRDLP